MALSTDNIIQPCQYLRDYRFEKQRMVDAVSMHTNGDITPFQDNLQFYFD